MLIGWQGTPLILHIPVQRDLGGRSMSLAIVLMGWVAASLVLSPVIGRFLSFQDQGEGCVGPRQIPSAAPVSARLRQGAYATMRRNATLPLSRRDAGWPRAG